MSLAVALTLFIPLSNNLLFLLPERIRQVGAATGVTISGALALIWLHENRGWREVDIETTALIAAIFAGAAALTLVLFRAVPALTRPLEDRRIAEMSRSQFALYAGMKIPVATALAEEALFRGLLWFAIESVAGPAWALGVTAVAFGLWHVVVSARQGNDLGAGVVRWVLISVLTTTLAGLGFGWLRLVTGGIWAPVISHCVINVVGSIGARMRARRFASSPSSIAVRHT